MKCDVCKSATPDVRKYTIKIDDDKEKETNLCEACMTLELYKYRPSNTILILKTIVYMCNRILNKLNELNEKLNTKRR
jgi:hypothetical protein